jgi:hypothetical protein
MRWFVGFIITSFVSIGVALLLSNLTEINEKYNQAHQEQMQSVSIGVESKLSDQNIVDRLINLPLNLDIHRVDWSHSILSIDLKLTNSDMVPTLIYKDLIEISHFGLDSMDNVKEVLIRVFDMNIADPSHVQFMLAMNAHRDNWSTVQYESFEQNKINAGQFLRSHFSFTSTQKWERFVNENG